MARNLGAAAATAEARTPGPPQCLIFRSQPEPARPLKLRAGFGCGEDAGVGTAMARGGGAAGSDAVRLLLDAASAFFVA